MEEAGAAPLVIVVVLNWNDPVRTLGCLRALAASRYANMRTVMVDNGSSPDGVESLTKLDGITLIRNRENLGFTGGVNVGIDYAMAAGADYIWLLNSDAQTSPEVLGRLVAVAQSDSSVGLVSPVFHDPDAPEKPEFCLSYFDPAARYATQTDDPAQAAAWQIDRPSAIILPGTALLIRRAVVERIGLLDSRYFAYVEDVDYCLRASKAGFRCVSVPDAMVLHKFKQPVGRPDSVPSYLHYFISRNYLLLWKKLPRPRFLHRRMLWFLRQRLLQIERMPDQLAAIDAVISGVYDGLMGVTGPYDAGRRPLALIRWAFGRRPGYWINLIDGRWPFAARSSPDAWPLSQQAKAWNKN